MSKSKREPFGLWCTGKVLEDVVENLIHPRFKHRRYQSPYGDDGSPAMTPGHSWWGISRCASAGPKTRDY